MVETGAVLKAPHATETVEVLATPKETTDRYRVRLTAPPGGGSGVTGLGPHVHRGLAEVFRVVGGTMTVHVGDDTRNTSDRDDAELEVPAGTRHGFLNTGKGPLVVEMDLVFTPPGPRPEADLLAFWAQLDRLARSGRSSPRTGMPPLPQVAVLLSHVPEAFTQPGIPGLLLQPLAVLGRLRGYRWTSPDDGS